MTRTLTPTGEAREFGDFSHDLSHGFAEGAIDRSDIAWAQGVLRIAVIFGQESMLDRIAFASLSEAAFAEDWASEADSVYDNA